MSYQDILDKIDSRLVNYFGGYCEVRSLEFLLKWGEFTEHPRYGKICKKLYNYFCNYYSGFIVPQDGSLSKGNEIMPYESILELIKRAKVGRIWPCSCKSFRQTEPGIPRATCMFISEVTSIDDTVTKYENSPWLPAEDIMKRFDECEEAGLVHQMMCVSNPLGRKMYVICNCDTKACVPMYLKLRYDIPFVRSSGFICEQDNENCSLCETCITRCPFKAISLVNGKIVTDSNKCLGCGVCISKCSSNARKMRRKPSEKIHQYTVQELKEHKDQSLIVGDKGEFPKTH